MRSSPPIPRRYRRLVGGEDLVDRQGIPHRRLPHLGGQVSGHPGEELLVRLMHIKVVVAQRHAEAGAHADVLVRLQPDVHAEVLRARPPVEGVDGGGDPAAHRLHQRHEDPVVQNLVIHVLEQRVHEDIRPLEQHLVDTGAECDLRMEVRRDEARHHEMVWRSHDTIERSHRLQADPGTGFDNLLPLDDQRPVGDESLVPEVHDRVAYDQCSLHVDLLSSDRGHGSRPLVPVLRCRSHRPRLLGVCHVPEALLEPAAGAEHVRDPGQLGVAGTLT